MKVPNIANVTIAPKFKKKGFCQDHNQTVKKDGINKQKYKAKNEFKEEGLTGERLNPDWVNLRVKKKHHVYPVRQVDNTDKIILLSIRIQY